MDLVYCVKAQQNLQTPKYSQILTLSLKPQVENKFFACISTKAWISKEGICGHLGYEQGGGGGGGLSAFYWMSVSHLYHYKWHELKNTMEL